MGYRAGVFDLVMSCSHKGRGVSLSSWEGFGEHRLDEAAPAGKGDDVGDDMKGGGRLASRPCQKTVTCMPIWSAFPVAGPSLI